MKINVLLVGSGCGVDGRARGIKAVDIKQGTTRTREDVVLPP
jgi:hypothetical protein